MISICLHIHKSADGNCFVPSSAEPSVVTVEGPCTEQSEQILQRLSLFGSVGACSQPARPMNLVGILMCCVHWVKSNFTRPVLMSVLDSFGTCPREMGGAEKNTRKRDEFTRSE